MKAADVRRVSASALRAMLLDGAELALLDVREERIFSESHLLFARSVPLSRLELRILGSSLFNCSRSCSSESIDRLARLFSFS